MYGIQYHIDIPVKGLNGVTKTVRIAWITQDNITISLTTAFIADMTYQQNIERKESLIVKNTDPKLFWEELYNLACKEAMRVANEVIPTPMYVSDYGFGIGPGAVYNLAEIMNGGTPAVDMNPFHYDRFKAKI